MTPLSMDVYGTETPKLKDVDVVEVLNLLLLLSSSSASLPSALPPSSARFRGWSSVQSWRLLIGTARASLSVES